MYRLREMGGFARRAISLIQKYAFALKGQASEGHRREPLWRGEAPQPLSGRDVRLNEPVAGESCLLLIVLRHRTPRPHDIPLQS